MLHVAKFVRMIPLTVMMGFTNGLALVIGISQLHAFKVSEYQVRFFPFLLFPFIFLTTG